MQRKPIFVLFLTVFIDLVGFGIIIPLNPFLARKFGADPFQVGLLMTIYSLLQFAFAPFWGQISDRWGRRPVMLVSLMGASMAHGLFAFSESLLGLFIARGLAGAFGGNISAAMASMADLTEKQDRSKGMGLIGAAFGLGFVFGPFLGGVFADLGGAIGEHAPWGGHFPALMASFMCLLNFGMALFILPETNPFILGKVTSLPDRLPRLQVLKSYFARPGVGAFMIIFFLITTAMAHMEASLFMLVQDRFHWSMGKASMGFAVVGLMIAFTQGYLLRKLQPRFGEVRLIVAGVLMMAISFALIGWAQQVEWLAVAMMILAVGSGLAQPSLNGVISLLTPGDQQGGTMGANQSLSALGRVIGPALGGLFYREWGASTPFYVAGGLSLLAFVFWPRSIKFKSEKK